MRQSFAIALLVATAAVNLTCSSQRAQPDGIETRWNALTTVLCDGGAPLALSVGHGYSACKVLPDHTAECWGKNSFGLLGDGTTKSSTVPVRVAGLSGVVGISAGGFMSCAVLSTGRVACWGGLGLGVALGDGTTSGSASPVMVSNLTDATAVSVGVHHACALHGGGKVTCWGNSVTGLQTTPVEVSRINNATAISAGDYHTCALLQDGFVACWGDNAEGQLGDGNIGGVQALPVIALLHSNASAISAGGHHSCAVVSGSTLRCWGDNYFGQLGDGTKTMSGSPRDVSGLTGVVDVAAGYGHTCARLSNTEISCWGDNGSGQLGSRGILERLAPGMSVTPNAVTALSVGGDETCVVYGPGGLACWGNNLYGNLGRGETLKPVAVEGLTAVTAISAGGYDNTALRSNGSLVVWGSLDPFAPAIQMMYATPIGGPAIPAVAAVASGLAHTCALQSPGTVKCWGAGGLLGDGTGRDSATPVSVKNLSDAKAIAAASGQPPLNFASHTCAIRQNGQVVVPGTSQFWPSRGSRRIPTSVSSRSRL